MNPIDFPESNMLATKPESMTDEQCVAMNVLHGQFPDGSDVFISCWEMSDEELEQIKKTKKIWVWQYGDHIQPIALDASETPPFRK